MKKSIILKKISLLFFGLLLPLLLFSSISLLQKHHELKRSTLDSLSSQNSYYVESLDSSIRHIHDLAASTLARSEIGELTWLTQIMSEYEKAMTIKQLREYINSVKNNSTLIENVRVYIGPLLQAYNTTSSWKSGVENLSADVFGQMADLDTHFPSQVIIHNDQLIMLLKSDQIDPNSLVEISFSESALKKEFSQSTLYPNANYLFIYHNGSYIVDNVENEALRSLVLSTEYENGIAGIWVNGRHYYAFSQSFETIDASYIQVIADTDFLQPFYQSYSLTLLFLAVMGLCVFFFFMGVIRVIHQPMKNLIFAFQQVENGDLSTRITETVNNEFSYLYQGFNEMTAHLEQSIDEVYNQKLLLQKAEFKQLQAQINPHFLYNSFFMLQRMIKIDARDEALLVSKELGLYFKYITKNHSDFELLKEEYEYAKIYSNIQAMRFENRITVQFNELPKAYETLKVPRLILQPLLENAYNHGLENKISNGFLQVSFSILNNGLAISIEDNGEEMTDEQLDTLNADLLKKTSVSDTVEITALINIHRRIQAFYNNGSGLELTRSRLGGLKATIFLVNVKRENFHEKNADCR